MNKELKRMNYSELVSLNEKGEINRHFLHYDIYKNSKYLGTIIKVDNDTIVIETGKEKKTNKKMAV